MIRVDLTDPSFSYDVHSLVQAFYPGTAVRVVLPGDAAPDNDSAVFHIAAEERMIRVSGPDGKTAEAPVPEGTPRTEVKNILKRTLYGVLAGTRGYTLPWGALTGIRPVKIPMKVLREGGTRGEAEEKLRKYYFANERSAALAAKIALREIAVLGGKEAMASGKKLPGSLREVYEGYSLYISLPFCPSICAYCSFPSGTVAKYRGLLPAYFEALDRELSWIAETMKGKTLCSVYIGGGTPTALPIEFFEKMLVSAQRHFPLENAAEITVEAGRPETILPPYLSLMKEYGVNRISVNPQTMQDKTLQRVGRAHTAKDVEDAFERVRDAGFGDINMDLIVGLPGETEEDIRDTLRRVVALGPEAVTVHSLAKKRASRLAEEGDFASTMLTEGLMDEIIGSLREYGCTPYYLYRQKNIAGNLENIGFAKEGYAGLYNILMMEEIHTVMAAGAGAVTKVVTDGGERTERAANVSDISNYLERTEEMLKRKAAILPSV